MHNWVHEYFANEEAKKQRILDWINDYDLASIIEEDDPFIELLTHDLDEQFFESLYMKDLSLDELFETHFYCVKLACHKYNEDFNKFIRFFEDKCIPKLLLELAFKHNMDSCGSIDFFIEW